MVLHNNLNELILHYKTDVHRPQASHPMRLLAGPQDVKSYQAERIFGQLRGVGGLLSNWNIRSAFVGAF
jgi:hypothetical protein